MEIKSVKLDANEKNKVSKI